MDRPERPQSSVGDRGPHLASAAHPPPRPARAPALSAPTASSPSSAISSRILMRATRSYPAWRMAPDALQVLIEHMCRHRSCTGPVRRLGSGVAADRRRRQPGQPDPGVPASEGSPPSRRSPSWTSRGRAATRLSGWQRRGEPTGTVYLGLEHAMGPDKRDAEVLPSPVGGCRPGGRTSGPRSREVAPLDLRDILVVDDSRFTRQDPAHEVDEVPSAGGIHAVAEGRTTST
jgi:hypothetical protein